MIVFQQEGGKTYSFDRIGVHDENRIPIDRQILGRVPMIQIIDADEDGENRRRSIPSWIKLASGSEVRDEILQDLFLDSQSGRTGPGEVVCLDKALVVFPRHVLDEVRTVARRVPLVGARVAERVVGAGLYPFPFEAG